MCTKFKKFGLAKFNKAGCKENCEKYWSCKIKVNTAAMLVIKNKRSVADCVF